MRRDEYVKENSLEAKGGENKEIYEMTIDLTRGECVRSV